MTEMTSTNGNKRFEAHGEELLPGIPDEIASQMIAPKLSWRQFYLLSSVSRGWHHVVRRNQVLPGIPNEIALVQIARKLSWRDFYTLSLVSRSWHYAIRSRQVYHARVCSGSTETLILVRSNRRGTDAGSTMIYLISGKSYVKLPPVPFPSEEMPLDRQCVSLNGKIYVLGGRLRDHDCSDKVFVLDVAGQRQWKECAPMRQKRSNFGCGVLNGKIYVCGGASCFIDQEYNESFPQIPWESEVYDPEDNAWSPFKPMISWRIDHREMTVGKTLCVEAVEEELFVHGGWLLNPSCFDSTTGKCVPRYPQNGFDLGSLVAKPAGSLEVYCPGNDEWRIVEPFWTTSSHRQKFFAAQGKFFSLSSNRSYDIHDIRVLARDQQSWLHLYSFSLTEVAGLSRHVLPQVFDLLPVGNELVGKLYKQDGGHILFFAKTRGFGCPNKKISWHKDDNAPSGMLFTQWSTRFLMYPFLRNPLQL